MFSLFFKKDHIQIPDNKGEKRESLVILEKVGMCEGLLKSIVTEADVILSYIVITNLDWDHR